MNLLLKIASGIDAFNRRIGQLMFLLLLVMILVGIYNATVRYLGGFFGANLSSNAYLELQWYMFGSVFMLGAAYTLQKNGHVRVDVLQSRLSEKGQGLDRPHWYSCIHASLLRHGVLAFTALGNKFLASA